jgi:hypothetical protein
MKRLSDLFSYFERISAIESFLDDFFEDDPLGAVKTFFIPLTKAQNSGWDPFQIRTLLAGYGIKSWGDSIDGDEFSFNVRLDQVQWTEYVLYKHGVPVNQKSSSPPRPSKKSKPKRSSKRKKKKTTKHPFAFLDEFFDE